jgi:hypothetical protein
VAAAADGQGVLGDLAGWLGERPGAGGRGRGNLAGGVRRQRSERLAQAGTDRETLLAALTREAVDRIGLVGGRT